MKTKIKKLKQKRKKAGLHSKPTVFNLQKQYFVDVFDDLFYKFTESLNVCSLYFEKNITAKIEQLISAYNNKANKEITFFSKSNFSLSFKPFLLTQGIVVFAFIAISLVTIGSFLIPKPQISQSQIIKNITLKQTSAIIAKGQPIKWTITVNRSDISSDQAGQHLVKLPKTATNINVKTITKQEAENILTKTIPQASGQLTIEERKKLAIASTPPSFFIVGILSSISNFLLASVNDSIDQLLEVKAVTQESEVITIDDVKLVDLSGQAPAEQQPQEAQKEDKEKEEEKAKEETNEIKEEKEAETQDSVEEQQTPESEQEQQVSIEEQPVEQISAEIEPQDTSETSNTDSLQTSSPSDQSIITAEPNTDSSETSSTSDQQIVQTEEVQKQDEVVQIDFETPPPIITEEETIQGKQIIVSDPNTDPDQPQLTDVLAFTTIPEIFNVGQESKIQIKWQNNGDQDMQFNAYDLNDNGKLDYVEWTVPHLSEQIFNIIFISKAFKLDQNKDIIEDIYDIVRYKDNNWSTINSNQYVRVTFEKILTNQNDITLYARVANGVQSAKIEVYPVYPDGTGGDQLIATFDNIDNEDTYRIVLTNLQTPTDVFDLKIINNNVDIDYIVDPTYYWVGSAGGNTNDAANWATSDPADCTGGGAGVPTTGDTAIFDADCDNSATINANLSIATLTINTGYTGTITQSAGVTITIATAWTQADGTFTGGNSSFTTNYAIPFTLSGGTFNATSGTTFLGGAFTFSGGTFNAGTGTVEANNNDSPIWDFASAVTFNNFTLNKTSDDGNVYIGSADPDDTNTMTVNGTLTLGEGRFSPQNHHSQFILNAKGPISVLATHDGGGGGVTPPQTSNDYDDAILYINGTSDQSFTIPAGAKMTATTLNNSLTTISTSGSGTITWIRRLTITAGTFNAGSVNHTLYAGLTVNGGTFTGGSGTVSVTNDVNLSSGTLTAPSSTLTVSFPSISLVSNSLKVAYNWTHTAGGTFNHNSGTVEFSGDTNTTTTIDLAAISTSGEFNNVTVNITGATPLTIASGDTMTANGTFTWTDGGIDTGTVAAKGTVVVGATADGNISTASTLTLSGSSTQTCTLNGGGAVSALTINNASATCTVAGSGTFTFDSSFTLTDGIYNGGSITNDFNGTASSTVGFTISGGTFTASSGNTQVIRAFTHTAGTFNHNDGTVVLDGGLITTINVPTAGETFKNLTVNRTSGTVDMTISSGDTLIVTGTLTLTNGEVHTGTLEAQGAVTIDSTFDGGTAPLTFTGTANQTLTDSAGSKPTGTWTINKSSGTVTLATAMVVNATGQDLTITSGTLDLAGFNLTVNDVFTLDASGTLKLQGGETVSTIDTITAGSTVNYNGTTDYTGSGLAVGDTYSNLTFSGSGGTWALDNALTVSSALTLTAGTLNANANTVTATGLTTVSGGTYQASTATQTFNGGLTISSGTFTGSSGAVDVNGNLTLSGGTLTAPSGTFTVSGNWAASGSPTFTPGSNTVTLDGTSQTITGSNTFYSLTKSVTSADTLTFTAGTTQTISSGGTLTLNGASGQLLTLASSSAPTTWKLTLNGTPAVSYVSVSDSDASTGTAITHTNTTDGGNNLNWSFDSTDSTPAITSSGSIPFLSSPLPIIEQAIKIPEKITEQVKKITEQITQVQQQLANLLRPKEQKPTEIVSVPQETPFAFQNIDLLSIEPIQQFVLAPLPNELQFFTEKFVGLKNTLTEVGVSKISDIVKLEDASFNLPGLLSFDTKQNIPTEIVFAKTGDGLIDLNIALSINKEGTPEQEIRTIVGKPLELVIKPDKPVQKIKGYLILKRKNTEIGFLQNLLQISQASLIGSSVGQIQNNNTGAEQKLVLQEFEYKDTDEDGIYSANIQTPVVDGNYEIVTVMDYQDPKLALREFQLIVVVDPEGYIYEQLPSGQLRINNANVSLYWLNPDSQAGEKNYELWTAKKYLQDNPQTTDNTGKYSFLVPEGEYYLKVVANNYFDYQTNSFTVTQGDGIHMDIKMQKKSWWGILIDWLKIFKK